MTRHPILDKVAMAFQEHPAGDGTIYIVGNRHQKQVKIGFTSDSSSYTREKHCQTHSPHEIQTLAECPGSRDLEKRLHAILNDFHWRGEWFFLSVAVEAVIKEVNKRNQRQRADAQRKAAEAWEMARVRVAGNKEAGV